MCLKCFSSLTLLNLCVCSTSFNGLKSLTMCFNRFTSLIRVNMFLNVSIPWQDIYIYVFKWFNSSQASVYLLPEFQVLDKLQYVVQILDKLQYVVQILDKLQYVVQVLDKLQYVFQLFCARFNCLTRFKGERWH